MSQLQPTSVAGVPRLVETQFVFESPFNPRKRFNQKSLTELANDIVAQGIVSPILVRPRPMPLLTPAADGVLEPVDRDFEEFEIVFGHRRYRAALLAALPVIPCLVRDMTDKEVMRAQISENLSREDVHPIEEAEGFQALLDGDSTLTAEKIAEDYGRSRSYVYGRLTLLQAIPEVREACLNDEYGADVALLIARLRTEKFQLKALEYIRKDYRSTLGDGGKQSFRTVRNLLNEKFALGLAKTLFDREDVTLVPAAGACSVCPKRAGNAPEFDDIANPSMKKDRHGMRVDYIPHDGADVCTDPDCFDAKKAAHHKRRSAELQAQGKSVVDGNKARGAVSAHGEIKGAYIALADVKNALPKGKKKDKATPDLPIVEILDPRTDKIFRAVRRQDLKAAGLEIKAPKKTETWQEQHRRQQEESKRNEPLAAAERAARQAAFRAIRAAIPNTERSGLDTRLVARIAFKGIGWDSRRDLAKLWGKSEAALESAIESTMTNADLTVFLLDCALIDSTQCGTHNFKDKPVRLANAAAHYGIDLDDLRARASRGEDLSTPTTAARAAKGATGKAEKKSKATSSAGAGVDLLGDPIASSQSDDAGSAGEKANDEPADAGAARDPNTSDMFSGAQA